MSPQCPLGFSLVSPWHLLHIPSTSPWCPHLGGPPGATSRRPLPPPPSPGSGSPPPACPPARRHCRRECHDPTDPAPVTAPNPAGVHDPKTPLRVRGRHGGRGRPQHRAAPRRPRRPPPTRCSTRASSSASTSLMDPTRRRPTGWWGTMAGGEVGWKSAKEGDAPGVGGSINGEGSPGSIKAHHTPGSGGSLRAEVAPAFGNPSWRAFTMTWRVIQLTSCSRVWGVHQWRGFTRIWRSIHAAGAPELG